MDSFHSRSTLKVGGKEYEIYKLHALDQQGVSTKRLPFSLRILLENLLRTEDGRNVKPEDIRALFFAKTPRTFGIEHRDLRSLRQRASRNCRCARRKNHSRRQTRWCAYHHSFRWRDEQSRAPARTRGEL